MVDPIFGEQRLANIYDPLDADRRDLAMYAAIVDEFGAQSILDLGCGTGTLACLLALQGRNVTGLDPALASLEVARRKPGAGLVRWQAGDASAAPPLQFDLAMMTGNVAQVFLTDNEWTNALRATKAALRPGGLFVFESRDPLQQAWQEWDRRRTYRQVSIDDIGSVETWVELTEVRLPFISFRWTFVFESDGAVLSSDSTLRFRTKAELSASLEAAGFVVREVRDAPDRPRQEFVFLAERC